MDIRGRIFLGARWNDERGDNVVGGFLVEDAESFTLLSLNYGEVVIPDGAVISRPNRPLAIEIGTVENGELVDR
jgi:hypothetical protein